LLFSETVFVFSPGAVASFETRLTRTEGKWKSDVEFQVQCNLLT